MFPLKHFGRDIWNPPPRRSPLHAELKADCLPELPNSLLSAGCGSFEYQQPRPTPSYWEIYPRTSLLANIRHPLFDVQLRPSSLSEQPAMTITKPSLVSHDSVRDWRSINQGANTASLVNTASLAQATPVLNIRGGSPTATSERPPLFEIVDRVPAAIHEAGITKHRARDRFNCPLCGVLLCRKSYLTAHLRVHSRERPYICFKPGCHKSFRWRSNLTRHAKDHMKRSTRPR